MSDRRLPDDLQPEDQRRLTELLPILEDPATWSQPPPDLRARVLDEANTPQYVESVRPRLRGAWLALAAAVVAAVVGFVVLLPDEPTGPTFALAGTDLAPDATATAEIVTLDAGIALRLEISGLPPAEAGMYYAAWMEGESGVVAAGSFHWHDPGPVGLWSGVEPDRYPHFFVTLQSQRDGPDPSDRVVMEGRIDS